MHRPSGCGAPSALRSLPPCRKRFFTQHVDTLVSISCTGRLKKETDAFRQCREFLDKSGLLETRAWSGAARPDPATHRGRAGLGGSDLICATIRPGVRKESSDEASARVVKRRHWENYVG